MKTIQKTAKKFLKSVNGNIDFVSVEKYLLTLGYHVIFFNTPAGDNEIKRYNLEEKAAGSKAFTYIGSGKIIFIDNNLSADDKTYLLYHEAGHILIGHTEYERLSAKNKIKIDIESDAFAYAIMNPIKRNKLTICLAISSILFCMLSVFLFINMNHISAGTNSEVYVTATGTKYHTKECFHVRGKDTAKIEKHEADKIYMSCSVCNPQ